MSSTGYLQVYAYVSNARLPIKDVAITVEENGKLLSMGLTDSSGKFGPIAITVPDRQDSLFPGSTQRPFTSVNLHAKAEDHEQIEADNIQIFANTTTVQQLEMIPLSELPEQWTKSELFNTPAQNL